MRSKSNVSRSGLCFGVQRLCPAWSNGLQRAACPLFRDSLSLCLSLLPPSLPSPSITPEYDRYSGSSAPSGAGESRC